MNRRTALFVLALAVGMGLLGVAQQANAITIIPPSFEKTTDPDQVITMSVMLFNESSATSTFTTSTANFTTKDEKGTPDFFPETNQDDLAGWITIDKGPFTILPGQRMEIPMTIKVPATADPGGHYTTLFFNEDNVATDTNTSGVKVNVKVGMNILLSVNGDVIESAQLTSFTTVDGKNKYSRLPVTFNARITNNGNVHVRPIGTLTIRNLFGGTTITVPFNATQGAILPTSVRKYEVVWDKETPSGSSTFFKEFVNEWNNFALGPYTADLALTYGAQNDKLLTGTYKFFVFPWRIITLGVILIGLVLWLIIFLVKRYNHWIVVRASRALSQNGNGKNEQTKKTK